MLKKRTLVKKEKTKEENLEKKELELTEQQQKIYWEQVRTLQDNGIANYQMIVNQERMITSLNQVIEQLGKINRNLKNVLVEEVEDEPQENTEKQVD